MNILELQSRFFMTYNGTREQQFRKKLFNIVYTLYVTKLIVRGESFHLY